MIKFSPLSESDSSKTVENGDAIVLYCEVSHPSGKVSWLKDGVELQPTDGLTIQSDGNMRRIVIQSADTGHSGVYTCETSGDVIKFNVDVAGNRHSIHKFTLLVPWVSAVDILPSLLPSVQVLLYSLVRSHRRSSTRAAWNWTPWCCSATSPERMQTSRGKVLPETWRRNISNSALNDSVLICLHKKENISNSGYLIK